MTNDYIPKYFCLILCRCSITNIR
uniref:Uncharacterized protein n=1 Tax=Arundo donax TaxID=35708 RepID=A0A0A8YGL7_ARUDO